MANLPSRGPVTKLDRIRALPTDILSTFLLTRKNDGSIPDDIATWIIYMNIAANLLKETFDRGIAIQELQDYVLKNDGVRLSDFVARHVVDDSIIFFHLDCNVTAPNWNAYYAEKLDQLAQMNIETNNLREARRCLERANEFHIAASDNNVDPALTDFKIQLISPDVRLDRMGETAMTLTEINNMLKTLDVSDAERARLIREASIELNATDAEIIEDES